MTTAPAPYRTRNLINAESIARHWNLANRADRHSNMRRWLVALPAFRAVGKRDGSTQVIADAIQNKKIIAEAILEANNKVRPLMDGDNKDTPTDTVERLARAYKYFLKLYEVDPKRAKQARRNYGYSRFAIMWDNWLNYEFDINEKGFEYLELGMSNLALSLFIENVEDSVPEWKRRSTGMYKSARKLLDDLDVPAPLRDAAGVYVQEYDKAFPPAPKNLKRKV